MLLLLLLVVLVATGHCDLAVFGLLLWLVLSAILP
jgi:hypothetical protein